MDRRVIIAIMCVVAVLIAGAMSIAWTLVGQGQVVSSLTGATAYKPTSRWVADGVDPDVATFELSNTAEHNNVDVDGLVASFVQEHYSDLMPCYAKALEVSDVSGRLDMRFGVLPDGSIALVEVTASQLRDPELEDCAVPRAREWHLRPTGREIMVKFDADFTFAYE